METASVVKDFVRVTVACNVDNLSHLGSVKVLCHGQIRPDRLGEVHGSGHRAISRDTIHSRIAVHDAILSASVVLELLVERLRPLLVCHFTLAHLVTI